MLKREIIKELKKETADRRRVLDITLEELYQIDHESAGVLEKEFEMSLEDHIQLIITDWTICAYSDYNEQVQLFEEVYENFDRDTLKNYLDLL